MESSERIKQILDANRTGEKKAINYDGKPLLLDVKEIPLDVLLYNPYNGRIRSMVKSFESSNGRNINNEDVDDINIIEQFLWDSARGKNEKTLESLKDIGQQEVGIITKDGVIIDGNRRTCLLNVLRRRYNEPIFFKAVVLDDNLKDNGKAITVLETRYQMGVDSKVDYNPIEKYIKCFELLNEYNFTIPEIADLMTESETDISKWLNIFQLMEEYLEYVGTKQIYTRLEKREGHFVDLYTYINLYKRGVVADWEYDNHDILDMQNVYFDYIRLGIPVQRARVISKPSGQNSFFCKKNIWTEFIEEHKEIIEQIDDLSFQELKLEESKKSNEDLIKIIDFSWREKAADLLIDNLSYNEIILKEISESYLPLKILKRVKNSINNIKVNNISEETIPEVMLIINDIENRLNEIKNIINIK
ncbi:hypothetical protein J2795_001877 [Chryseobacterium bernardetii]|uniref:ParB-like nuclease family protein n=2 Tax=Chryseobacterium TaxID=59732 RepID=A0A543EHS5_9FLAO|nr:MULTISPECIES: hypothetical protein [Chryseobacterium]MDR6371077.1 hypothetical protein [Chryseobacterium vietnamense]MDR6441177.1 hypothetical protein [Chryseobacterium bernardetii]TQM21148.1 hypothetical protein FB551_0830 [Chryseobacterium aquifrigidense]